MGYVAEKECILIEGIPVQFLPAYNQLLAEALNEATQVDYAGLSTKVLTAEHLVAIALQTGRAKDRARVQMFLADEVLDTVRLKEILQKHDLQERWLQWTNQQA